MGYRSEVGIVIKKDFRFKTKYNNPYDNSILTKGFQDADRFESPNQLLFIWDYVKWCEPVEELFLGWVNPQDFLMIRIGKDCDDVQIEGMMWDNDFNFGWTRSLVYEESNEN